MNGYFCPLLPNNLDELRSTYRFNLCNPILELQSDSCLTIVLVPSPRMALQYKIENPSYFTVLQTYPFFNSASTTLLTYQKCVVNLWICASSENMALHHVSQMKLVHTLHHANLFFMCCFVIKSFFKPFFQKAQTSANIAE